VIEDKEEEFLCKEEREHDSPDPLSFAVDAMSLSWDGMFAYAFPPFRFLLQVLLKIKQSDCKIILIAPAWPRQVTVDCLTDLEMCEVAPSEKPF
jgi:hypothetical protein